tara:strand:+ start:4350 stop:5705 length:1356 start_codon:yes stop_codon:yes gene_type:complete
MKHQQYLKNSILLLLLSLFIITTYSQLPKGDRILAWQVDMAQNNNYDSAYAYAQIGCMESIHLTFAWSSIEPNSGIFDLNYISNVLDIANIYYPAYGTKVELQIPTMNTNVKVTPTDLILTDFDDIMMINRFKTLLDTLFAHIPNVQLSALNIGNESDIYMGSNAIEYNQYKTFLDSIVPYAKQLYFNLHGESLKVGTTFSYHGLVQTSTSSLCQMINNGLDIIALTYYPLNSDFTMKSPSVVNSDFSSLVGIYSDTLQPIYFTECGYASSDSCNSSNALQAQFYQNVFNSWDNYYDNIKYLTIFKSTDWSQQEVSDLGTFYGITDIKFLEFLKTLGVRTWDNNGTNKPAYETILCELNTRAWCSGNCNITGINKKEEINIIKIYPNPTNGLINIDTKKLIEKIKIYTVTGNLSFTSDDKILDIHSLSNGIYYLSIEFESGKIERKKIIKL